MPRLREPVMIRADWWDADEAAWVRTSLSFLAAQTVAFHQLAARAADATTPEGAETISGHIIAALFELLDHWTLRTPGVPYQEGLDRPVWELTPETIGGLDVEDVAFLFGQAMARYTEQTAAQDGGGTATPTGDAGKQDLPRRQKRQPRRAASSGATIPHTGA